MKKSYISLSILIIIFANVQAQTYYGKKTFGRLQIISDSINTITFISCLASHCIDDCYIRKQGDTVFLSTHAKWRYKVNVLDKQEITANTTCCATVIKIYQYSFPDKKYKYWGDGIGIYDSIAKSIILENVFSREHYIIIYKDFMRYCRIKCSFDKERNYVVLEKNPDYDYFQGVILDDFPLLIKRNRLIPMDKEKQMQCWLDNGFFFPKMKMSKKNKKYHVINGHYIGLRNLPTKMEGLEKLKPLPRKNMKYLEN